MPGRNQSVRSSTPVSKFVYKSSERKENGQNAGLIHTLDFTKTPKTVTPSHKKGQQKTPRHIAVSALLNAVRSPQSRPSQNFEEISATSSDEESSLAEYAKERLVSPGKARKKKPGITFQSPTRLPLQIGTQTRKHPSKKPVGNMYRSSLALASSPAPSERPEGTPSKPATKTNIAPKIPRLG
ncbi:hypothetical protein K493DRAFT_61093 [Basidiobolus meristosporus CBS 931.73]|uniref:Uncharacterized protein n=1 Tax=Basidiobolus meristosporus CBS 931.73 TaxID=1314790 RepID=A0A1Y1XWR5_9FUNG|nr:hypothetical protein K493DRAFT_61093 [Basidiobolus meristosporus CBS 931.73]|eukprot:ORX90199.1 hypothetical protein K493DRAFT_61093 [Basidiobolus meristosporus CBS 931.73]